MCFPAGFSDFILCVNQLLCGEVQSCSRGKHTSCHPRHQVSADKRAGKWVLVMAQKGQAQIREKRKGTHDHQYTPPEVPGNCSVYKFLGFATSPSASRVTESNFLCMTPGLVFLNGFLGRLLCALRFEMHRFNGTRSDFIVTNGLLRFDTYVRSKCFERMAWNSLQFKFIPHNKQIWWYLLTRKIGTL